MQVRECDDPVDNLCDNLSSCHFFSLIAPLLSVTLVSHRNTGLTGFEAKSGPIYGLQKHLKWFRICSSIWYIGEKIVINFGGQNGGQTFFESIFSAWNQSTQTPRNPSRYAERKMDSHFRDCPSQELVFCYLWGGKHTFVVSFRRVPSCLVLQDFPAFLSFVRFHRFSSSLLPIGT